MTISRPKIIDSVAEATGSSKDAAGKAVDATLEAIISGLAGGEDVTLVGFGSFKVKQRAARTGRNPRTGASIELAASKSVKFKAGKDLEAALEGRG